MVREIFNVYVEEVANAYGFDPKLLFVKTKDSDIASARHMVYFLCKKRGMKIIEIQKHFAKNGYDINHSSIIYGISSASKKMRKDVDFKEQTHRIASV